MLIHHVYPFRPGTDLYDAESIANAMVLMPAGYYICMLINNAVCSFLAGTIATLIYGRTSVRAPMIVGFVLTLSGLYYDIALPYPVWVKVVNLLLYMPFAWLGYRLLRPQVVPNS